MSVICDRSALASRGVDEGMSWPVDKNGKVITPTHQSFAKDADINNIMAKYAVSGVLVDPTNVDLGRRPRFGDFSDLVDYPTMVSRINQAQADFMTLPSDVRAKFNNSVEECLNFIADPANVREAVKLGLLPESMIPVTDVVMNPAPKAPDAAVTPPNDVVLPPAGK